MYERMLNKQEEPTAADMAAYCGEAAHFFMMLNQWLGETCKTVQKITFPYGSQYGWGIAHRIKKKLICNIFPEKNAMTVMMRLSDSQFDSQYEALQKYTQEHINHKYPCGDGGWIQYRVTSEEHFNDIQKLLALKCSL